MITWAWWNRSLAAALVLLMSVQAANVRYSARTEAGLIPPRSSIALQQYLGAPAAVAYDASGVLYYATSSQVWRLNSDGSATAIAPAVSFASIAALALDANKNLYIADSQANVIRKVTPVGTVSV